MPPSVDPDLVSYLRKHLQQHGADALRRNLVDEGLADAEIDAALAEASRPPPRAKPKLLPIVLGIGAAVAAGAIIALDRPAPAPADSKTAPAGSGGQADERVFHGRYGFVIKLPPDYQALSDVKDPEKTLEVVYVFPKGTDPTLLANESYYGHMGILRLEVSPLGHSEGKVRVETVKRGVTNTLQSRKANFESKDNQIGELPGFLVSIKDPFPLAQAFILGSRVIYVLTGGSEEGKFADVLNSLHEASSTERPDAGAPAGP